MLETASSFVAVPKVKKAALEEPERLNPRGLVDALSIELGKNVVPELRRICTDIGEHKKAPRRRLDRPPDKDLATVMTEGFGHRHGYVGNQCGLGDWMPSKLHGSQASEPWIARI